MSAHNDAQSDANLQMQGNATGKWMIGISILVDPQDVSVYAFDEQEALKFFDEQYYYFRIMYNPSGLVVKIATPFTHIQPSSISSSDTKSPQFTAIRMKLGPWAAQAASGPNNNNNNNGPKVGLIAGIAGGIAGGVGAAPAAVAVVQGIGFTSAGIAAGSAAAGMMAAEAVVGGGAIASGGLVATLQAVGATSSLAAAPAVVAVAVPIVGLIVGATALGALGMGASKIVNRFWRRDRVPPSPERINPDGAATPTDPSDEEN